MAKKTLNHLDLFSGIGGFHMGFQRAGFKMKTYFSEIDKHAIAVYRKQFPNAKYAGSVTDIKSEELPKLDLITFGSPCQDFSISGFRKGMSGERSSLILQAIHLIDECRPRVFIWENVKGAFSSNSGEDFAAIIQAFTNLGGYRLEWQLLNSSWFSRTPQSRERIYLVGYSSKTRRDWNGVFPIGEGQGEANVIQRYYPRVNTITARYSGVANGSYVGERQQFSQKEVDRIRMFTPVECERLQGFPDDHTKYGVYDDGHSEVGMHNRYKMCGNAVTVDVVEAIANKIRPLF